MHHISAYTATSGAAAFTLADMPAVADTVFTVQNNHFIYTDQLIYIGSAVMALTGTQGQLFSPSLVPYGLLNIWPIITSNLPGSFPNYNDWRRYPFKIPLNEQIQFLVSKSSVVAETDAGLVIIGPINWTMNKTMGLFHSVLRLTATATRVANGWSGLFPVAFQNLPVGGWYAVNGAYCLSANSRAFRFYFPRAPTISGRQLRPGLLCTAATGNLEYSDININIGTWGAFHTFEPLQVEVFADAAGADALTIHIDVQYLGQGDAGAYPALAA